MPSPLKRTFVIGTRGSRLALRQVELVEAALRAASPGIKLTRREISTDGDRSTAPLSTIGGLGVFTKAIEDALLAREIDIAVHSLKDLPADIAPGLTIAAVPPREDVRDALVTANGAALSDLPAGARIGTGAGRRAVQLRELRANVETAEIRGNVDTRIRKVEAGDYDGCVLAMAGLARLGLTSKVAQVFTIDEMLPAVGQGALAVEVRAEDADAVAVTAAIEDAPTRVATEAERAFLRRLGAGCRFPVGAYGVADGTDLHLRAMLGSDDGPILRGELRGATTDALALGAQLAEQLLAQSADFVDA